jgi:Holliday junction resolvase RusA-like endonuclease
MYLRIEGHPAPKERPRSAAGQRGVYQPISEYERLVTETAKKDGHTFPDFVSVAIHFHCFGSRGDIDNLAKAVLDGLTEAGIWQDDKKVVVLQSWIHKAHTRDDEQTFTSSTC